MVMVKYVLRKTVMYSYDGLFITEGTWRKTGNIIYLKDYNQAICFSLGIIS